MFLQKYLLNFLFIKDVTLLVDIFRYKNVQNGVVYHCWNAKTAKQMIQTFNLNNVRISSKKVDRIINSINIQKHEKVGVFVDTSCEGWTRALNSVGNQYALFKSGFMWFVMTENLTETIDVLSPYAIDLDSDVTIISKYEDNYILYEIYHTGFNKNGQLIVTEIGKWNESLHIEIKYRKDLKGLVLRSIMVIPQSQRIVNKTLVKYFEEEQPDLVKVDPMHKFKSYTALQYFRDMFNISYDFQRSNSWGYPTSGGFDGLVGILQRMEADIGGTPIFIRTDRLEALDYAAETWLTRPSFIFRHPKHSSGYLSIYTRPLTIEVWYCVIVLMMFSAIILGLLLNLKIIKVAGDEEDMSPSLALLLICSAICQQGMTISRSSNAVKIMIFTTFLFALTIYQYYNATVVSTLLRELPKNIKTLTDLSNSSLEAGVEDILYNKDFFQRTTDPVAREIYLKKVVHTIPHRFFSPERGMALVKKGGFAFHVDSAVAYRIIRLTFSEQELCELQEVNVFGSCLGFAVTKRSPYKEIMAYGLRKLKETGLLSRLSSSWDEPRPACFRTPDSSLISVNILEFSTALMALAFGYCAASVVIVVEILVANYGRKRNIGFRY